MAAKNENTEEQKQEKQTAQQSDAGAKQDAARNAEATGDTATTPVNEEANFSNALSEATERGYLGGADPEERFAEEERQRRIRAGLV